jgi:hypothetical protein
MSPTDKLSSFVPFKNVEKKNSKSGKTPLIVLNEELFVSRFKLIWKEISF